MESAYLNLVKKERDLKTIGKTLSKESPEEYKTLIKYQVSLLDHFQWEKRYQYLFLLTLFQNKKIDADGYMTQLFQLEREAKSLMDELELDFEKLKDFEPNSASKEFSKFIGNLVSDSAFFQIFRPRLDFRNDFEISEDQFRDNVKEIFLQIQKYM